MMKAHWNYLKYVIRHKWHVYQASRITGASRFRGLIHDWSKFLPCEWFPYVDNFYADKPVPAHGDERNFGGLSPVECEYIIKSRNRAFDHAWNHHQKANKHHWQYWVLINDSDEPKYQPMQMPEKYVREMVADWVGAGIAITGRMEAGSWYAKNKDNMVLHEISRGQVESIIRVVEEYYRIGRHLGMVSN